MEDSLYIFLPLFIFLARILDVSINTIRIIFVLSGKKYIATLLGFFESLIWLLAISQIFEHLNNFYSYIAYPAGFACGILVGMWLEEKLALGKVVIRIITRKDIGEFKAYLVENDHRFSIIRSEGPSGQENILFMVIEREQIGKIDHAISKMIPSAFYTVEGVKSAQEAGILTEKPSRRGIGSWLSSVRRN